VVHHHARWHTGRVPTTRPRHQVTETDAVAHALDVASRRWPEKSRGALVTALVEEAGRTLERDEAARLEERRRLVDSLAGGFDDVFYDGYLEELREDRPE